MSFAMLVVVGGPGAVVRVHCVGHKNTRCLGRRRPTYAPKPIYKIFERKYKQMNLWNQSLFPTHVHAIRRFFPLSVVAFV